MTANSSYTVPPMRFKHRLLARRWRKRHPSHYWWECKLVQSLWKILWRFFKKLKIELPSDLAITLLGIYPKIQKH